MSDIDFNSVVTPKGRSTVMYIARTKQVGAITQFSKKEKEIDLVALKKQEKEEMDEKFGLPDTWARHTQTRTKQDNCNVCEDSFSVTAMFGMGNRDFYCKHCGFAVCEKCSTNRKFLSKDGKERFRVCDLCDVKLDNIKLRLDFDKFLALKDQKIDYTKELLSRLAA